MKEKNEMQIAIYPSFNHAEIQMAYSLPKHISTMVNAYIGTKTSFYELGIGYYRPLLNNKLSFEVYGGYGQGFINYKHEEEGHEEYSYEAISVRDVYDIHTDYFRFFIQPNIGYRTDSYELGISLPVYYVNYPHYSYKNTTYKPAGYDTFEYSFVEDNFSSVILKPTFFFKGGEENVFIHTQMGFLCPSGYPLYFSYSNEKPSNYGHPSYMTYFISSGIQIFFNTKKKQK